MEITVDAVYENGVLTPLQPLPLPENQRVQVTVQKTYSSLCDAYGIMGFKGTAAEADYFALSSELDLLADSVEES